MLLALWCLDAAAAADGRVEGIVRYGDARMGKILVRVEGEVTREVATGPQGAWAVELPPGDYTVLVGAGSERAASGAIHVDDGGLVIVDALLSEAPADALTIRAPTPPDPTLPTVDVTGQVMTDSGAALAGARVYARGLPGGWVTDDRGNFRGRVPAGTWDALVVSPGYETTLAEGNAAPGTVRIDVWPTTSDTVAGMAVEVEAAAIRDGSAALLTERREAAGVSDVVSAGQMARTGDTDAAGAMRRVTGLSVIGGKYVYVRGLGDRYSASTLDGALLPSPEPEKRVVPLDLFPTALLDGVVVQKTFSPELPGEFGGGVVQLRSRSIPERATVSLGVSGGWVGGTTASEALVAPSGPTDWLGFGLAGRSIPAAVVEATETEPIAPQSLFSDGGFTPEELEALGEAFPNRWGTSLRTLPPDFSASASAGGRIPLGGASLGVLAGGVFSNGWSSQDGFIDDYSASTAGLARTSRADFSETRNTVRLGTMGTVSLGWGEGDHLTSVTLYDRNSVGSAFAWTFSEATGTEGELTPVSESYQTGWLEQSFLFERLSTRVTLGPIQLAATGAYGQASTATPDERDVTYGLTDAGANLQLNGTSNEISYTTLDERTFDVGGALTVPLRLPAGEGRVEAGGGGFRRERESNTRRFSYVFHGSEGIDLSAAPEDIFTPENIGATSADDPGWLEITELTIDADDYTAGQRLTHAYVLGDVPWTPRIRTLAGARVERSTQEVATFERFTSSAEPVTAELTTTDILPAATLTLGVAPGDEPTKMLVRLSYGRTVSRPELRELSAVPYYDYRTHRLNYGNPDLARATIDNVDVRWEWYPREAETVSIGAFYKHFQDPIESVVEVAAVSGSVGTFANVGEARNIGGELEVRQSLEPLAAALSELYVVGNVAVIHSRVDLTGSEGLQTSTVRPLQGQSPYLVNAVLGYDHAATRTIVNVVYNVTGPRIVQVGTSGIPDTYELPVHTLDALVTQGLTDDWKIRLKGTNLLAWPSRQRTGEAISQQIEADWSVSVGVVWSAG